MSGVVVRVAATAQSGPGTVLTMNHPVTADAGPVIIHGNPTTSRIRPKNALQDPSATANMGGPTIALPVIAAGIISAVDDGTATAGGVRAVGLPYDPSIAAEVGLVIVDLATAAGCGSAVRARP